jgi:hypothetical protein
MRRRVERVRVGRSMVTSWPAGEGVRVKGRGPGGAAGAGVREGTGV